MDTVDLLHMLVSELMQLDTIVLSEMEEIRKIGFLERHKMAGSDGLSLSFFKCGDEVLTSELIKLLRST